MTVLPSGFALPPPAYLLGLAVGIGLVGWTLWRLAPPVTAVTVLGLVPWMVLGSALHALSVLNVAPAVIEPLVGAPAVYATAFIALGTVWSSACVRIGPRPRDVAVAVGAVGVLAFVLAAAAVLLSGDRVRLVWPTVGLVVAAAVSTASWALLRHRFPTIVATGWPGVLVLFAHGLDGVTTAIGVDVLDFGERTPLSRAVMDVAAALPTAEVLGVGWLFVLVKLAVAGAVLVLFADFLEEDPRQAYLLFAVVAAVGIGPGVHNLLLYMVA